MTDVVDVDPQSARELVEGGALLLDVRRDDEWEAGHAPMARHLPVDDLEARLDEVPRDTTVVCVCRGGGRSRRAATLLASRGIDARNLAGGMKAWQEVGQPVVTAEDSAGTVL